MKLSTPHAILIGSAMIGAGLYLGLRAAPVEPSSAPTPSRERKVEPARASDVDVRVQALAQLERHRGTLLAQCWPADAPRDDVDHVERYQLNFTFDGKSGQQLTRGLHEERGNRWPQIAPCIERALPAIAIDPPGENTYLEVSFTLP